MATNTKNTPATMRAVKQERVHVLIPANAGGSRCGTLTAIDEVNHKCRVEIDGEPFDFPMGNVQRKGAGLGPAAHSVGPWAMEAGREYVIRAGNGQIVFLIGDDRRAIPMGPDGMLICAAPELLASLADLADQYDRLFAAWQTETKGKPFGWGKLGTRNARETIAKATGAAFHP
jgi:hypothetical protein